MIENSEITFVVQGSIIPRVTSDCIFSIMRAFPDSRIIVSTWVGEDVSNLCCDLILESDDPRFYYSDKSHGRKNNVNRQIVSTLGGLKRVNTKYAFKIRSDFIMSGNSFLDYWDKYLISDQNYQVFDRKILACSYFTRSPSTGRSRFPFHPSDLAFFGLTVDLIRLFDVPLMTESEAYHKPQLTYTCKYFPEQHIFINCLRNNGKIIQCNNFNDVSSYNTVETEKYFVSNFIFLNFEQLCLIPTKSNFNMRCYPKSFRFCITHHNWLVLYKRHLDKEALIPLRDYEAEKIEQYYRRYRKYSLFLNFILLFTLNKKKKREIRNYLLEYFLV